MGNKQSMSNQLQRKSSKTTKKTTTGSIRTPEKDAETLQHFTPPSNTLSSLKANKSKPYSFNLPKNSCWTTAEGESPIDGELGDRKFVRVDSTRCLLVHKEKTEAILLRNARSQTIHVCSFTPPGDNHRGVPLFEWGLIGTAKGRCRAGYTMTTPYDGSYSVRCVTKTTPGRQISKTNNNNKNNITTTTMIVSSSKNDNRTCATFEETQNTWECRTMGGIDPAMMVCFVVALETLRAMQSHCNGSMVLRNLGSIGAMSMNKNKRGSLLSTKSLRDSCGSKSTTMGSYGSLPVRRKTSSEDLPPITSFINARAA